MITFLGTDDGINSIRGSHPTVDPATRDRIELVTYRDAFRRADWHAGCIVFGDLERLFVSDSTYVAQLWQRFQQSGAALRLMNDPTRALRRFALLRRLRKAGINDFDVWRADEERDGMRFPVILHGERDHNGPIGGPIHDRRALDAVLRRIADEGQPLSQIMVIEYCETRSPDGLYRKYGTFRVGDRLVHRHLYISSDWCVKNRDGRIDDGHSAASIVDEEEAFMLADEFDPLLSDIFRLAGVDYGRIDYAYKDGAIRVWEINTNPMLGRPENNHPGIEIFDRYVGRSFEQLRDALLVLDPRNDDTPFWIDPVLERRAVHPVPAGRAGLRRLFGGRRGRTTGVRP